MGLKLYNALVNRQDGIRERYHAVHDGTIGAKKLISWLYLLWLNIGFYVLQLRFLGTRPEMDIYENKKLSCKRSESEDWREKKDLSVEKWMNTLLKYDVFSFDIFDTLIFRAVAQPTDVFYFIGEKLGILDFKNMRTWAEWDARVKYKEAHGHMEIGLEDIWKNLEQNIGCSWKEGMQLEKEAELSLCYTNPFMLEIWKRLQEAGKRIVVVSDMYLPLEFIRDLLEKNGFVGAEKIYVSCEYGKSKADGRLFQVVKEELGKAAVIHVGDNMHSDVDMAKKNGFAISQYPAVSGEMKQYRPYDMSYLVGSAYRALVSAHLYNGSHAYGMEYEYGYLYGGLFVTGYCQFIHDYVQNHKNDKILFLSRDGDILQQAYRVLFPEEETAYVYWSRKAATKLMADENRHDYFKRFIEHKVNQRYTLWNILHAMELDFLADEITEWKGICLEGELTDKNSFLLRRFIEAKWGKVLAEYREQQVAAKQYYREVLQGCSSAVAVDIGWAGSGALALSHLVEEVWHIPCSITGLIAGTNTIHNAEPDAAEPFLQSGKLVAYLYSQSHNRDLLKKHDPNKDYNVFWELLLSSPQKQFAGFGFDEAGEVKLHFGKADKNPEGIREIQRGILDFVRQYKERFQAYPYMFRISGRDAYAPMLVAASHNERYLKAIEKKFALKINVD